MARRSDGAERLLRDLSDLVARQRAAIIARDMGTLARVASSLETLLAELGSVQVTQSPIHSLREQIRLNLMLLDQGRAAAAHFVETVAEEAPADAALLYQGVA
jgi:hypothetical protein